MGRRRCIGRCTLTTAALVDLLIESGAKVRVANRYGMTPLAARLPRTGPPASSSASWQAGADANERDRRPVKRPLMTAARSDRVEAVKVLLAHGADVNARETFSGQTAPHVGGRARERRDVVEALLEAGVDVHAKTPTVLREDTRMKTTDFLATIEVGGQTGWVWSKLR